MTVDELQVLVTANTSQLKKEMASIKGQIGSVENQTSKSSGVMSAGLLKIAAVAATVGVSLKGLWDATRNYGALEQNLGGAEAVFENYAGNIKQKAQESAGVMGTSINQYLQTANKMGSLFQGTGATVAQSFTMTSEAMQRATDVASVMGVSVDMALESVAGMAKGNFTMMDNLGVAMNDANIQAYMLTKGIDGTVQSMTTGQKVAMAYQMFMDGTTKYAGNFARESITLEGALAIMKAQLANVSAELGSAFAPMVVGAAQFISNYLLPALSAVVPYVVAFMTAIGQAVAFVSGIIGGLLGIKASNQINGVGKSAGTAAKAVSGIGGGAQDAATGLDGATGSANKLKKALGSLAGFDQMNVLAPPPDASGGGGGAGGAGGIDVPMPDPNTTTSPLDAIRKKAGEILDKIKDLFKKFMDNPFMKGVEFVFKTVADGIVWAWNALKSIQLPQGVQDFFKGIGDFFAAVVNNQVVKDILFALGEAVALVAIGFGAAALVIGIWNVIMGIATIVGGAFAAVMAVLTSPITLVIGAIVLLVAIIMYLVNNWSTVTKIAQDVWNTVKDKTAEFVGAIGDFFKSLWDNIVSFFGGIGKWFGDRFTEGWNGIKNAFGQFVAFFQLAWLGVQIIFGAVGAWFSNIFTGAWNGIKNVFGAVGGFFQGIWNTITSIFGNIGTAIGNGIAGAFKSVVNAVIGFAQNTINGFIDAINVAINMINKIPNVHIGTLPRMSIPKMAKGGVVDKATLAVVGEAGKEAVMPLENNTGWIDVLAGKLSERSGNGAPTQITVKIGEDTIIKKVVDGINDLSYMNGEAVIQL